VAPDMRLSRLAPDKPPARGIAANDHSLWLRLGYRGRMSNRPSFTGNAQKPFGGTNKQIV
jgi:hypothetical protein